MENFWHSFFLAIWPFCDWKWKQNVLIRFWRFFYFLSLCFRMNSRIFLKGFDCSLNIFFVHMVILGNKKENQRWFHSFANKINVSEIELLAGSKIRKRCSGSTQIIVTTSLKSSGSIKVSINNKKQKNRMKTKIILQ